MKGMLWLERRRGVGSADRVLPLGLMSIIGPSPRTFSGIGPSCHSAAARRGAPWRGHQSLGNAEAVCLAARRQQVPELMGGPEASNAGRPADSWAEEPAERPERAPSRAQPTLRPIRRYPDWLPSPEPPPPASIAPPITPKGAALSGRGQMIDIFC
ncbi:MAG: hypothetical protein JJU36_13740 [Phycisphaeraceae bacterium]|nr:hypothetical protein [Phycisphaeraceae bacterium]